MGDTLGKICFFLLEAFESYEDAEKSIKDHPHCIITQLNFTKKLNNQNKLND